MEEIEQENKTRQEIILFKANFFHRKILETLEDDEEDCRICLSDLFERKIKEKVRFKNVKK